VSALLEVEGLRVTLPSGSSAVTVVNGVDYEVADGQVFGIAGESGSGKTVSALALMGLLPSGARTSGSARFAGADLLSMRPSHLRRLCGSKIGIVFQDPLTSFHPMLSIGRQLTEHVRLHLKESAKEARQRATALLEEVRIPDPERALDSYPHQFSGGMRQRIAIASALACEPTLLIADEPTTALDVTVQAGIIRLLDRLRREHALSVVLITHDLGVMSAIADELAIFYAGRIVERGAARDVLQAPRHPYTRALLDALPHPELPIGTPLRSIGGAPPRPASLPRGCAFHPRCGYAQEICFGTVPPLVTAGGRSLACHVDPFAE
jgi:oligopeptide/dipeptide ABC transporter ATP-binding protein